MSTITITFYDRPDGQVYVERSGDDSVNTPAVELAEAVMSRVRRETRQVGDDERLREFRRNDR